MTKKCCYSVFTKIDFYSSADGKKPRVKSNLNFNQNKGLKGLNNEKLGLKASSKVRFDQGKFKFVPPAEDIVLDYEVDLGKILIYIINDSFGCVLEPIGWIWTCDSSLELSRHKNDC